MEIERPTKEQYTIKRLRKQLKATQERASRLEFEAGTRYLKSLAARWFTQYTIERDMRMKAESKAARLEQELLQAKRTSAHVALDAVRKLVEQEKA